MADWYFLLIFLLHETITSPRKENVLLYFSFVTVRSVDNTICQEEFSYMHTIPIVENEMCYAMKIMLFRCGILKEEKTLELREKGLKFKLPQTLINSLGL